VEKITAPNNGEDNNETRGRTRTRKWGSDRERNRSPEMRGGMDKQEPGLCKAKNPQAICPGCLAVWTLSDMDRDWHTTESTCPMCELPLKWEHPAKILIKEQAMAKAQEQRRQQEQHTQRPPNNIGIRRDRESQATSSNQEAERRGRSRNQEAERRGAKKTKDQE